MFLLEHERETYTHAGSVERYSDYSPGEQYLPMFRDMAGIEPHTEYRYTVLDAGTGSGKGALALQQSKFNVMACDFVDWRIPEAQEICFSKVSSLWDDLRPQLGYPKGGRIDYVYCTDVLEHIPPEFTMLTVRRLLDISTRGLFLSIAFLRDVAGPLIGHPLHRTVQPFTWWRDRLRAMGTVTHARDLLYQGAFLVEPRRC